MSGGESESAGILAQSTFNFKDFPELMAWHGELEKRYPGRGYAVLHFTSASLMVSDVRAYALTEVAGPAQGDISEQMLACQSALVKGLSSLGIRHEDFIATGRLLWRALMLHARPNEGARLN
jgi:hypothetical protein